MTSNDKKYLAVMPTLKTKRVDMLLEDVIGFRWTISVLRAVASGIRRPGALERYITGISKVLNDRLRHLTRAGIFSRTQFGEISPRVEYRLTEFGRKFTRLLKVAERLQAEMDAFHK
jgi:DNA-binding HxlR family transcriptional regulator